MGAIQLLSISGDYFKDFQLCVVSVGYKHLIRNKNINGSPERNVFKMLSFLTRCRSLASSPNFASVIFALG